MILFFKKKKMFDLLIFDAHYYHNKYQDLKGKKLSHKELRAHFLSIGIDEGRSASQIFDSKYYIENNNDIRSLVDKNFRKAISHFLSHGVHENRRTSPSFNVNYYYHNNDDLKSTIGFDYLALYKHFMQYGKSEQRLFNPNAIPNSFMIELTNKCNLRCETCPREYEFGQDMNVGNMDNKAIINLLDQMMPLAKSINLTGLGETFLYANLPEIVDKIVTYGNITTFLSTNAQTPNCLSMVNQIKGKINLIQVSIDGVGKIYEKVRNKSSFDSFSKNIKAIAHAIHGTSTSLMLNMVAYQANYHTIPEVVSFANEHGIRHIHINSRNLVTMSNISLDKYKLYKTDAFLDALNKGRALAKQYDISLTTYSNTGYCDLVYNH
ncbi:hypothetical protein MNBD_DELTA03-1337, partial [hydrothermal vent metagenome]